MKNYKWNKLSIAETVASAVLLLLILIIGYNTYANVRFEYTFKDAIRNYGSDKISLAEGPLETASGFYPNYPQLVFLKGAIAQKNFELDKAEKLYSFVEEKTSGRLQAAARLGRAIVIIRKFDKIDNPAALDQAEKILKGLQQGNFLSLEAKVQLGNLYLRRYYHSDKEEQFKKAEELFKQVSTAIENGQNLKISAFYDYLSGFGGTLIALGEYNRARTKYERLYQLDPKSMTARINRGYALARYYAGDQVSNVMGSRNQLRTWIEYVRFLVEEAESEDKQMEEELRKAGYHLGLGLLETCFNTQGRINICSTLRRNMKGRLKRSGNATELLNLYNMAIARPWFAQIESIGQKVQDNPAGVRNNAFETLQFTRSSLKEILDRSGDNLPGRARRYIKSQLAYINFIIGLRWTNNRLKDARDIYLELHNSEQFDDPVLLRNLAIVFYKENEDVKRKYTKAHDFGEEYLALRPEDTEFKTWFDNELKASEEGEEE